MAEPLSIAASASGVIDVCVRLGSFLLEVKRGSDSIDIELDALIAEIESIRSVAELLSHATGLEAGKARGAPTSEWQNVLAIRDATLNAMQEGGETLLALETVVKQIAGDGGPSVGGKVKKYLRKLWKEDELQRLWAKLTRSYNLLQLLLTAIDIQQTRQSQASSEHSFAELSASMQTLGDKLGAQIASLQGKMAATDLRSPLSELSSSKLLELAEATQKYASPNMHYMTPQSVSSTFTGRRASLEMLSSALAQAGRSNATKRFVIYGLGGSGKTQFCCKFARDHREVFWGIFYIDAGTPASTTASYAEIAEKANIESNERSVKYWLSSQRMPWLLIVDNVDSTADATSPEEFIPESSTGFVIFTTRNHSVRTLGNFGPRFFEFKGLDEDESTELFLASAGQNAPFVPSLLQSAKDICKALGYLPLALVQAGRAILGGLCTAQTCLSFLEHSLLSVQSTMKETKERRPRRHSSASNEAAFSTYEMILPILSDDAIELLKLFSFMHRQRLDFTLLVQAILNPRLEKASSQQASHASTSRQTWRQRGRDLVVLVHGFFASFGEFQVMPKIFQQMQWWDQGRIELRLRKALAELRSFALVDVIEVDDKHTSSMHPLIHWWVRARMTLPERSIWYQAACNTLANAILLPPMGDGEEHAQLLKRMLPHVEDVRNQEVQIQQKLEANRFERRKLWPVLGKSLRRADLRQFAKFSLVYRESAQWLPVQELMSTVDTSLARGLGLDHFMAIKARLLLSEAYWWLDEEETTFQLQQELLNVCMARRGKQDVETLNVMDKLGMTLWSQGRLREARQQHEVAVAGLRKAYTSIHVDTCLAMTHLGRVIGKLAEFDEAVSLHREALQALIQINANHRHEYELGSGKWAKGTGQVQREVRARERRAALDHEDREILGIKENLAMALYDRNRYKKPAPDDLNHANGLLSEVALHREDKLGKEHPLTLLAYCNLARVRADLGHPREAEDILRSRIPIAERNLGSIHFGTLYGKTTLGQMLLLQGKLVEAEALLSAMVQAYESKKRDHPDQLVAASFLLGCYQKQGKYAQAQPLIEKVIRAARDVFGENSSWEDHFVTKYAQQQPQVDRQQPPESPTALKTTARIHLHEVTL